MSLRQDPITWRQIGLGYIMLLCIGVGSALSLLDRQTSWILDEPLRTVLPYVGCFVLYGVCKLLERPLSQVGIYLAPTPDGNMRLKRTAVGAMWLLSICICVAGSRITQMVNPW